MAGAVTPDPEPPAGAGTAPAPNIGATLRVAGRRGFSALTIDAIAREAGITRPVVYELFGELDGLLRATLQDTLEHTLHAVQELLAQPAPCALPRRWGGLDEDVIARMLVSCAEEGARLVLDGESTSAEGLVASAGALLDGIEWLVEPRLPGTPGCRSGVL